MTSAETAPRVAIIGGGLAGLAAAVALAERQTPCTLFESRPRLGGRASSFTDRETGETIDNCQHVAMGCCTNFAHFCRAAGIEGRFRTEKTLHFIGPDGEQYDFSAQDRPAPFHLAAALGRLKTLSRSDRVSLAFGLRRLAKYRRTGPDSRSFADWLRDHRQSPAAIESFWKVVLVSALSESLDRIDIGHARKVLVDGFLSHRDGWTVQIPTAPLDAIYGADLARWLAERGSVVRLRMGVEKLIARDNRVVEIGLRDGSVEAFDEFILAVPQNIAPGLLPPGLIDHPSLTSLQRLETSPISSVHLWFDRPVTPLPHAVFIGRLSQWMFQRSLLISPDETASATIGASSKEDLAYHQVVISASRELEGIPAEGIVARVVEEFEEIWPATRKAKLRHSRFVTERRAVFAPTPGVDAWRPSQQTPIDNLQLAGDWTRTGWPATMEGAVRSGFLAAENVLRRRNRFEPLLQPDLPAEPLARWLFGLPEQHPRRVP